MPAKIIKNFGIKCTHQALRNQVEATTPLRPCSRCSGSGWEPNSLMEEGIDECPICKGEGCISERTYLVLNLDPDTGEVEGTAQWTVYQILREINRDRGACWTDYDESDWQEGWILFVEGKPCYGGAYHAIPELWKSVCVGETTDRKVRIRSTLKEASISIACALEDNMENLQMSDLEDIQDHITRLENLFDPLPFTDVDTPVLIWQWAYPRSNA